jgi:hypothetical protein
MMYVVVDGSPQVRCTFVPTFFFLSHIVKHSTIVRFRNVFFTVFYNKYIYITLALAAFKIYYKDIIIIYLVFPTSNHRNCPMWHSTGKDFMDWQRRWTSSFNLKLSCFNDAWLTLVAYFETLTHYSLSLESFFKYCELLYIGDIHL